MDAYTSLMQSVSIPKILYRYTVPARTSGFRDVYEYPKMTAGIKVALENLVNPLLNKPASFSWGKVELCKHLSQLLEQGLIQGQDVYSIYSRSYKLPGFLDYVNELYRLVHVKNYKIKVNCTGCACVDNLVVVDGKPISWGCTEYAWGECPKADITYPEFTEDKQLKVLEMLILYEDSEVIGSMLKDVEPFNTEYPLNLRIVRVAYACAKANENLAIKIREILES